MAACPPAEMAGSVCETGEGGGAVTNDRKRVLFVCLYNLQRSVAAEMMFRKLLGADSPPGADTIDAGSAGFIGRGMRAMFHELRLEVPEPTFDREMPVATRTALMDRGMNVSAYRSREADPGLLASSELVVCMLPGIRRDMVEMYPELEGRVYVLQDFLSEDIEFYWEKTDTFPHDDTYFEFVHNDKAYVETVIAELEKFIGRAFPAIVDRVLEHTEAGGR